MAEENECKLNDQEWNHLKIVFDKADKNNDETITLDDITHDCKSTEELSKSFLLSVINVPLMKWIERK